MKKFIFILFAAIAVLVIFSACDPNGHEKNIITIGVILFNQSDDQGLDDAKNGIVSKNDGRTKLDFVYSNGNKSLQNGQIDTFLAKNVDVLAISLVDASDSVNTSAIMTKANNAEIPTVFFLTGPGSQTEFYEIAADQNEIAELQGEIIVDYWKKLTADLNGDGKMQYIMVHGTSSHPHAMIRKTRIIEFINESGINTQCLKDFEAPWILNDPVKTEVKEYLETLEGQTVEMIICGNDNIALGMIEVLGEIGFFPDIPIVGIDGLTEAVLAVNYGKMLGTVCQDCTKIGEATFDICYALGIGNKIPEAGIGWTKDKNHILVPSIKIIKN